jgi:hypothetical protein
MRALPVSIVFAVAAACGHTEPAAHPDAISVGPTVARPATVAPSDAAASPTALSGVAVVDAAPEAEAPSTRRVGNESRLPAASPTSHCLAALEDAGAPKRTLIRFVNRLEPVREKTVCRSKQLVLEIPSLGVVQELCNSGCGPYNFDSQKKGPDVATFVCESDTLQNTGAVSVVDSVLHIEYFAEALPDAPALFDDGPSSGSRSPVQTPPPAIRLPCGTHPEFQTAGRSHWFPGEPDVKKSNP